MQAKVVFFHNKSKLNFFGKIIQWSVAKNNQEVFLKAITSAKQDNNGNFLLDYTKDFKFNCNHTGIAYKENNEWFFLLHMVESGLRIEKYSYVEKLRNYALFEKTFEVNEKLFKKSIQDIVNNQKDYQYGWFHALASFDFTKMFGREIGLKLNKILDKQRKNKKGQFCQGLVSYILLNSLTKEAKEELKEKIRKYFNKKYKRNLKTISDTYIIQETTPADFLNI